MSKYYTNQTVRAYIDRRLRIINEKIMPYMTAIDCTKKEKKKLDKDRKKLWQEIRLRDLEFYNDNYEN